MVTVLDNFHPQVHGDQCRATADLAALGVDVKVGNIQDQNVIRQALENSHASVVYHFAAETGTGQSIDLPVRYCETNVTGTANLIEAIRKSDGHVRRVVLAGSRAVYGEGACQTSDGRPAVAVARDESDLKAGEFEPRDRLGRCLVPVRTDSDWPPSPMSVYASTKLMQEYLLQQSFRDTGTNVGILRLQNVYGPGQSLKNPYTGVLSIFAKQLMDGDRLNIYEDGRITRDFVFIDDVVAAFTKLAFIPDMPSEILDIGTGTGVTILRAAREMLAYLGLPADRIAISGDFRPGDIRHAVADISRAKAVLDWRPTTGIQEGIAALLHWTSETIAAPEMNQADA
jgi:dTDP-L-rhamnose 4-epimerase